ncbi:segregation/condensation protein A [Halobacteriales archaeon QH_10_67_13]|nr:MAG: segregation/condensation protein A [Halobacteriales archaeon QH_10_67_13]
MGDEEVPLDLTGHENREPPSEPEHTAGDRSETEGEGDDGTDVEPVEVLVQLAEDGEIDPWDIDIVAVTDKFLTRLDEADLRAGGRALFYASVLLRMKGDTMLTDAGSEPDPEPEPWEQALPGGEPVADGPGDPFAPLEHEMDRRLDRKRARGMPRTLDELVRDLREAERGTWWKKSREYNTSDTDRGDRGTRELDYRATDELRLDDEPTAADVTERTHDEDMEQLVEDVAGALRERYEQGRAEVLFREVETAAGSRVETFLGLLFLANRGEVRLRQDDLFGDLWVQDPAAVSAPDEIVAD